MPGVDLSKFNNSWYRPGGRLRRVSWYLCNNIFFNTSVPYPSRLKSRLLKVFGARVGHNVTIKPSVNVKFPWFLEIGDNVWVGEGAWIDNLDKVSIGSNVCISQGAYILTGNHDYKKESFDLIISPVVIEDGAWVGAKVVVCPGAVVSTHAVLNAGSVVNRKVEAWTVYGGNPAVPLRKRNIS